MTAIPVALKKGSSKASVCRTFEIKRPTLYDALSRHNLKLKDDKNCNDTDRNTLLNKK